MAVADNRNGRNFRPTLHASTFHRANNYYERAARSMRAIQDELGGRKGRRFILVFEGA